MRASRPILAIGVSLLLHGALFAWLWVRAPTPPGPATAREEPLFVEVIRAPPPAPPAPADAAPTKPGPTRPRETKRKPATADSAVATVPEAPASKKAPTNDTSTAPPLAVAPRPGTAHPDTPRTGAPLAGTPLAGTSRADTPDASTSHLDTPLAGTSRADTSQADTPLADAPLSGIPIRRPLILTPSAEALAEGAPPTVDTLPRGRTIRPGDPSLAPDVLAAQEKARVEGRVQGWVDDGVAVARMNGAPHPYFVAMRDALQDELRRSGGGTPEKLGVTEGIQALAKSYSDSAEQYARTGNPGLPPPGKAPTQSERLQERFQNEDGALQMRMLAQAQETLAALEHRGPLFALKLELRQTRDGALNARVVESSGNPLFDDFVLTSGAQALGKLQPPPDGTYRTESRRSLWEVEGWLHQPQDTKTSALLGNLPGFMGIPVGDVLAKLDSRNRRFEFRARLLRAY